MKKVRIGEGEDRGGKKGVVDSPKKSNNKYHFVGTAAVGAIGRRNSSSDGGNSNNNNNNSSSSSSSSSTINGSNAPMLPFEKNNAAHSADDTDGSIYFSKKPRPVGDFK